MSEKTAGFDVACRVLGHVGVITLQRPHRRNALNRQAYDELEAAFRAASADAEVRAVVVTGADSAFCSGDDVGEMASPASRRSASRSGDNDVNLGSFRWPSHSAGRFAA